MKYESQSPRDRAVPAEARIGGTHPVRPLPWSRAEESKRPIWLQETFSLLSLLAALTVLFILWRLAALLIRAAAGTTG